MFAAQRLEWPLTERELLVAGRKNASYVVRFVIAAALCVPMALTWWFQQGLNTNFTLDNAQQLNRLLGGFISLIQFLIVFGVCARSATASIVDERDQGTLELLVIADPRGWDVALSKWTSIMVQCALLMLSMLPVQAVRSFLGGVDVIGETLSTLMFMVIAANVTAIGIYASAQQRTVGGANSITTFIVVLHAAAGFFAGSLLDEALILVSQGATSPGFAWLSNFVLIRGIILGVCACLSTVLFLSLATRKIRKDASGEPVKAESEPANPKLPPPRVTYDYTRPIAEMIQRGYRETTRPLVGCIMSIIVLVAVFIPFLGAFGFCVYMVRDSARVIAVMRRDGQWDDLLITRDDDSSFVADVWRGLRQRHVVFYVGITGNLFISIAFFLGSTGEGLAYWLLFAVYVAVLTASTTFWGTFGATARGTIRSREGVGGFGFMIWPLMGLVLTLSFAAVAEATRYTLDWPRLEEEVAIILIYLFNVSLPLMGILIARAMFRRRFDSIPEVGEPREGILALLFGT